MNKHGQQNLASLKAAIWLLLCAVLLAGCQSSPSPGPLSSEPEEQRTFTLHEIAPEKAMESLASLDLGRMHRLPDGSGLSVTGSPDQLERVGIILQLIDTKEEFMIEALVPASRARSIPSNAQIGQALGGIVIGTFSDPPAPQAKQRGLIDVHGEDVIMILPARLRHNLLALGRLDPEAFNQQTRPPTTPRAAESPPPEMPSSGRTQDDDRQPEGAAGTSQREEATKAATLPASPPLPNAASNDEEHGGRAAVDSEASREPPGKAQSPTAAPPRSETRRDPDVPTPTSTSEASGTARGDSRVFKPADAQTKARSPEKKYERAPLANGEDALELDLPEKIRLTDLLDLAAEYFQLDYLYEPGQVKDEEVSLRLHGKLQGKMRVKDLYPVIESVLKFKGLAMTRREGNLVTILPVTDALEADPLLVDPDHRTVEAGNMVVTAVFELRYIDAESAMNLLENMKLGVTVSPIADMRTIIVTCYAHRMERIEQLLDLVDKPGETRKFRFRQLKYVMATRLIRKVADLVKEMQDVPITILPAQSTPALKTPSPSLPTRPGPAATTTPSAEERSRARASVYLDADERRNRILMIGRDEQLAIVEELITALDVSQQGIRTAKIYGIKCVDATEVRDKLKELHLTGGSRPATGMVPPPISPAASKVESAKTSTEPLVEEPQIVVLEAINSLLVNATEEQHGEFAAIVRSIDVVPPDRRTLRTYAIEHVDAEEVKKQLSEFAITGGAGSTEKITGNPSPSMPTAPRGNTERALQVPIDQPQITVLRATNSLLVNATMEQHERIAAIIKHVDVEARKDVLPYEIYFLENQEPNQLAEVLGKLIQQTVPEPTGKQENVTDPKAKIEKVVPKTDESVTIIPDKNTFSLIVHANRKNQEWVASLIEKLDKRRPQVLIDVTLVEITKTTAFNYDLNLITSIPDLTATSGLMGALTPGPNPVTSTDIINKLEATGSSHFADFQSNSGELTAFYGDKHINLLLEAMQSKNYGRVLANPKILVNDNERGMIKTIDTTYVVKQSSIPVTSGAGGTQTSLIQTAVDYQSYEAGITLNITPHISQGDLLRLSIELTRSDFRATADSEKPPDKTSSDLRTTAFVPDGSTIILGGLVRLNQNKGGRKVPILGDIPLLGGLFRSINNRDAQSKLYIFVKTEIIRPANALSRRMEELERVSERNRRAYEKDEREFQKLQDWPGINPKPVDPAKVLKSP